MGGARRGGAVLGILAVVVLLGLGAAPADAAPAGAAPAGTEARGDEPASAGPASAGTVAKLKALDALLADPDIQALLSRRGAATEAPAPAAPPRTMALSLADRLQALRQHLVALGGAVLSSPDDARAARAMVAGALDQRSPWGLAGLFAVFVGLGFGVEHLFRAAVQPAQRWLLALTLDSVSERVRAVFARLGYGLGLIVFFGLGSVGAFLVFDWPAVIKEVLLGYLLAFILARLGAVTGRILLAPGAARFRVVPITTRAATFLYHRWVTAVAVAGFTWQTVSLFSRYGLSPLSADLWSAAGGLLLLLLGLDVLWRLPHASLAPPEDARVSAFLQRHHGSVALAGSLLLVLLWFLWVAGLSRPFWLCAFAIALPLVIMVARRSVAHVLRPPGVDASAIDARTLDVIVFQRGVRSLVIVVAALLLGRILGLDYTSLTTGDGLPTRVLRSAISVVVIALVADFVWHVLKGLIDRKIATSLAGSAGTEDAGHAARLATLLPIISNILLVVIVGVAGMMMLASAGVEIGPLIASAGVVGVAIGFGAQTLVRDIISGIFYLFDDAFRIGEYIQSGSYKGTVESFSLRSVKLRHQRGALYTVPFGVLGAVQNQSRDWVVDKIVMNVPYGTDLDRVRKLIKRIGEALLEDAEIGPDIINPLKMQGVVQFGDFAIQIQTKMMTKPGDAQFMARRRALLEINKAFVANGIGFAVPTVQVAGQGEASAAAASAALNGLGLVNGAPSA